MILASRVPGEGQGSRWACGIKFCVILDLNISLASFPATALRGHAVTLALSSQSMCPHALALHMWFLFLEGSSPFQGSFLVLEIPAQTSELAVSVKASTISPLHPSSWKCWGSPLSVLQCPVYIYISREARAPCVSISCLFFGLGIPTWQASLCL